MMQSILYALAGGAIIGLAASAMLLFVGRIAGISGIFSGLLAPESGDVAWRAAFIGGLLAGGVLLLLLTPGVFGVPSARGLLAVGAAGLVVGYGVRLGNGCTSGHGVCGISRLSKRSIIATVSFMATGVVTATVARLWGA